MSTDNQEELYKLIKLAKSKINNLQREIEMIQLYKDALAKKYKEKCLHEWQSEPDGGHGYKFCTKCDWL
jgi:hypothetical protein